MRKTTEEIKKVIIGCVSVISQEYGMELGELEINYPIIDLGLDSLDAIEIIVDISAELGVPLDRFVFWNEKGEHRDLDSVVKHVRRLYEEYF